MTIEKNIYTQLELLLDVLCGEISEKDPEFQRWLNQDIENRKLYIQLKSKKKGQIKDIPFNKDQVFDNISYILGFPIQDKKPIYRRVWFNYVASFIFVVLISVFGYYSYKNDINKHTTIEYQTIYVPRGDVHELLLSDSSKVFLNSDSKLVYPTYFKREARQVELVGEAFFEVKKGDTPFIVKTGEMQITVTGTSFNVNAYQDHILSTTTLVEGSVLINISNRPETYEVNSGNHFNFNKYSDEISIQKVNTERYTLWMKNEYVFSNQPLDEIFSALKSWYDFEIEYEKQAIRIMRFSGSIERERPLAYFLNLIQMVTEIKYRTEGEKIILSI